VPFPISQRVFPATVLNLILKGLNVKNALEKRCAIESEGERTALASMGAARDEEVEKKKNFEQREREPEKGDLDVGKEKWQKKFCIYRHIR